MRIGVRGASTGDAATGVAMGVGIDEAPPTQAEEPADAGTAGAATVWAPFEGDCCLCVRGGPGGALAERPSSGAAPWAAATAADAAAAASASSFGTGTEAAEAAATTAAKAAAAAMGSGAALCGETLRIRCTPDGIGATDKDRASSGSCTQGRTPVGRAPIVTETQLRAVACGVVAGSAGWVTSLCGGER